MRIVAKGDQCIVKLEDKISGEWNHYYGSHLLVHNNILNNYYDLISGWCDKINIVYVD